MLSKAQINNFLKLRKSDDSLNNIKNVIILAMIKYYKDMNIISFVDNISLEYSDKVDKVLTVLNNSYTILINEKLSLLSKIEYILNDINYLYNNNDINKDIFKEAINILQVEDIIKLLFKIIRLNNIDYFDEISTIDSKSYKCYINQLDTNLIRPIYNSYKKKNKEIVKNTDNFLEILDNDVDNNYVLTISNLFSNSIINDFNEESILNTSEKYRQIKDIVKNIITILNKN